MDSYVKNVGTEQKLNFKDSTFDREMVDYVFSINIYWLLEIISI